MIRKGLLFLAIAAASLVFSSCAPTESAGGPSNMPWNIQEGWEGTARHGNMPQTR